MFPMYCDLGGFKHFVTLSVSALRPQDGHSNCKVQLFQYVLGVLHFTEFSGDRGGCGGSSGINVHVSTTAKANIFKSLFNHNHRLYPIQTSMNVKMRKVAVITNV